MEARQQMLVMVYHQFEGSKWWDADYVLFSTDFSIVSKT